MLVNCAFTIFPRSFVLNVGCIFFTLLLLYPLIQMSGKAVDSPLRSFAGPAPGFKYPDQDPVQDPVKHLHQDQKKETKRFE